MPAWPHDDVDGNHDEIVQDLKRGEPGVETCTLGLTGEHVSEHPFWANHQNT